MQLVRYTPRQEELMRTPPSLPGDFAAATCDGRRHDRGRGRGGARILSEVEAKALLAAYGIPTVPRDRARSAEVGRIGGRLHRRARRLRGQDPLRRYLA